MKIEHFAKMIILYDCCHARLRDVAIFLWLQLIIWPQQNIIHLRELITSERQRGTSWCYPCRKMRNIITETETDPGRRRSYFKVNKSSTFSIMHYYKLPSASLLCVDINDYFIIRVNDQLYWFPSTFFSWLR